METNSNLVIVVVVVVVAVPTFVSILISIAAKVWEKIEPLIEEAASEDLEINAVAYRPLDGEDFTVLWPTDFEGEFEIA